ncbi:hypothetical protein M8C21_021192 [Ambrosia artemisiifolia]|uniref:Uncharacterized protein n=1 Tax=Ambrosia artemisiifolia TaxID=4212 RepID=A0AAD5C798_AMBAR|nr:hypothetical protein M8C21_021192 [Ambrosia artemisiifolia]
MHHSRVSTWNKSCKCFYVWDENHYCGTTLEETLTLRRLGSLLKPIKDNLSAIMVSKYIEYKTNFEEDEKKQAKKLKISCNPNDVACKLKRKEYKKDKNLCAKSFYCFEMVDSKRDNGSPPTLSPQLASGFNEASHTLEVATMVSRQCSAMHDCVPTVILKHHWFETLNM